MNEQDNTHHSGNSQSSAGGQELVPAGRENAESAANEAHAAEAPTRDITLQRLPQQDSWEDIVFGDVPPQPQAERRFPSMILMIGVAALIGALSSAGTAWFSFGHFAKDEKAAAAVTERNRAIDNALAQVNAELQSLKTSTESAAKANASKLAKFGESLEKLKSADVTGSIPAPAAPVAAPAPAPAKAAPQIGRLPTIDGWVVRDVRNGGALIEGRQGLFEVYAGDPLPGVGRVDAIRRQDGRWVVVTSRGLIVAR
ncbi:conserved hypothetical protein [Afipia carboxidovorans OM5]|uniref:Uncharacterized protein n=1 Tax=Afipia carboxidovorans (strain ATCC 49405 / DSM 1227 / KCTC 32145 / OM5) TaxID=504832 RepID=B6JBX6_AFIC5|nr:hypothetical protein [Afipia carboxidovorans]ACI92193.1 conserved hypothetical protein [Afipia carboxidovorans OM5]AEI04016.1 hypothetical protein OCA4_c29050 [Afipia carboxidovorans OM4]AEI07594.1 hypothetical protein OCA5_c29030 [Afipia carboxidovorans OM5]